MRNESFNNSLHVTCMIHICMYLVRLPISMLGLVIDKHCVKNIRIRSYSRPYCPAFELNMERYLSKCGKIRTRITPNTDTSHAVKVANSVAIKWIRDTVKNVTNAIYHRVIR